MTETDPMLQRARRMSLVRRLASVTNGLVVIALVFWFGKGADHSPATSSARILEWIIIAVAFELLALEVWGWTTWRHVQRAHADADVRASAAGEMRRCAIKAVLFAGVLAFMAYSLLVR